MNKKKKLSKNRTKRNMHDQLRQGKKFLIYGKGKMENERKKCFYAVSKTCFYAFFKCGCIQYINQKIDARFHGVQMKLFTVLSRVVLLLLFEKLIRKKEK